MGGIDVAARVEVAERELSKLPEIEDESEFDGCCSVLETLEGPRLTLETVVVAMLDGVLDDARGLLADPSVSNVELRTTLGLGIEAVRYVAVSVMLGKGVDDTIVFEQSLAPTSEEASVQLGLAEPMVVVVVTEAEEDESVCAAEATCPAGIAGDRISR